MDSEIDATGGDADGQSPTLEQRRHEFGVRQSCLPGPVPLMVRGFCMGAADVVPGVSGGTMAFILGIYEDLIQNLRMLSHSELWKPILAGRFREGLNKLNWNFLSFVGIGILTAIVSLARGITYLLEHQPILIWSFFFGLILASIVVVYPKVSHWRMATWFAALAGTASAFYIVGAVPAETPATPFFFFASGAIAICAMILPGISGSFILVLLGKYHQVIEAINAFRSSATAVAMGKGEAFTQMFSSGLILTLFSLGCLVGIVIFSRFIGWLLRHYHDVTVAVLIGFMLGSLRKIWPWKETLESMTLPDGKLVILLESNVLPPLFIGEMLNREVALASVMLICGFALVCAISFAARVKHTED